jgi:hypothetical protein
VSLQAFFRAPLIGGSERFRHVVVGTRISDDTIKEPIYPPWLDVKHSLALALLDEIGCGYRGFLLCMLPLFGGSGHIMIIN